MTGGEESKTKRWRYRGVGEGIMWSNKQEEKERRRGELPHRKREVRKLRDGKGVSAVYRKDKVT